MLACTISPLTLDIISSDMIGSLCHVILCYAMLGENVQRSQPPAKSISLSVCGALILGLSTAISQDITTYIT